MLLQWEKVVNIGILKLGENMYQLEICCGSFEDVKIAEENGADRAELNSALFLGGLTPSLASLILTKEQCRIPAAVMVRPRGGGFYYSEEEYKTMLLDTSLFLKNGADAIVFGFLKNDKTVDLERTKEMADFIHTFGKEAVFHRAFDCVLNQKAALEQLINAGIDRVLTSGGEESVPLGKERIKLLQQEYGTEIEILAGSGICAENVKELIEFTNVAQVHSSCRSFCTDNTSSNGTVDFSYAKEKNGYECVDGKKVRELARILKKM